MFVLEFPLFLQGIFLCLAVTFFEIRLVETTKTVGNGSVARPVAKLFFNKIFLSREFTIHLHSKNSI